jgi:ribosomal-protein-alanine N-acetyltransferase
MMKREKIYEIFSNIPTLHTERLSLRALHPIDAEDMFDYASREDVTRYLLWSVHKSEAHTRDYIRYIQSRYELGDFYDWAIIDHESRRMIGTCGFARIDTENDSAEIGYVLNPDFQGRGYATEASARVIEFGFSTLGLNRIAARFMQGNNASLRVMEKLGMTFEGYHRDAIYAKGEYKTIGYCAITRQDYLKD